MTEVGSNVTGRRIRAARCMAGLSQAGLAELMEKTSQNISQYENGARRPSLRDVLEISVITDKKPSYFFSDKEFDAHLGSPLYFRALSSIRSDKHRERYSRLVEQIAEYHFWLSSNVTYPPVNLPVFEAKEKYSLDDLEVMAKSTRQFWGIGDGPIESIVALLERNGIIVTQISIDEELETDAFSALVDGRPFIFVNSSKASGSRLRHNLAHELAHILIHNHIADGDLRKSDTLRIIEKEANLFASAFNLPAERFRNDAILNTSLKGFLTLKQFWKASISSMIMRSKTLGLIDDERSRSLFKQLSFKGWNKSEEGEEMIPAEVVSIGKKALRLLMRHQPDCVNVMLNAQHGSLRDVSVAFDVPVQELEQFTQGEFIPIVIEGGKGKKVV